MAFFFWFKMIIVYDILILGDSMNTRGFTLIELVITIALVSMMFSVIATNMVSLQNRQLEGNYTNYKEEIANAACVFMESKDIAGDGLLYTTHSFSSSSAINTGTEDGNREVCISNGTCYVKTMTLLAYGYLNKDLKNPTTGTTVSEMEIVQINYNKGVKSCLYYGVIE